MTLPAKWVLRRKNWSFSRRNLIQMGQQDVFNWGPSGSVGPARGQACGGHTSFH